MKVRHHFFSAIGNCFLLHKSTACNYAHLAEMKIIALRYRSGAKVPVKLALCSSIGNTMLR